MIIFREEARSDDNCLVYVRLSELLLLSSPCPFCDQSDRGVNWPYPSRLCPSVWRCALFGAVQVHQFGFDISLNWPNHQYLSSERHFRPSPYSSGRHLIDTHFPLLELYPSCSPSVPWETWQLHTQTSTLSMPNTYRYIQVQSKTKPNQNPCWHDIVFEPTESTMGKHPGNMHAFNSSCKDKFLLEDILDEQLPQPQPKTDEATNNGNANWRTFAGKELPANALAAVQSRSNDDSFS